MTETLTGLTLTRLAPWLTASSDPTGDQATYLSAISAMGEQLFSLIWDQGDPDDPDYQPGWGSLFDVDLCPTQFLPFLAQMVGVSIPTGTDDTDARQLIRVEQGMQRGTVAAIVAAASRFLSSGSPTLFERTAADGSTPDAYHFVIVVTTADVTDAVQLAAAVDACKPGGVMWTLIETSSWTIAELEAAYTTVADVEAAFVNIAHLETDVT